MRARRWAQVRLSPFSTLLVLTLRGRWAANAILLPTMTFLSNLRPTHAPLLMDHLINPTDGTVKAELWRSHFRGLIGQPVESQVAAYEAALHTLTSTSQKASGKQRERKRLPVRFITADGTTHDVSGYEGESLMEIAKREELGAVEGTCGGHLGKPSPLLFSSPLTLGDRMRHMPHVRPIRPYRPPASTRPGLDGRRRGHARLCAGYQGGKVEAWV